MTSTTTSASALSATHDDSSFADDDPRLAFARAEALAGLAVSTITAGDLAKPTPCTEMDVEKLAAHLLAVVGRARIVGEGGDILDAPDYVSFDLADLPALWAEAAATVPPAWAEVDLQSLRVLPWATMPAGIALAIYASEVTTHTWDLLTALGHTATFDDRVVAPSLATMRFGLPAEGREGYPFAEVVPVSDDAPLIDQLVAWNGRNPAWSATA